MKKLVPFLLGIILFFATPQLTKAQDDCCGLGSIFSSLVQSGIYGGYGLQLYDAKGLNNVLPTDGGFKDYGTSLGWRVGANLIGFRQRDFLVALKFHYQAMTETQEKTSGGGGESYTHEIKLDMSQWNLGMSFSYILSNNFDYRVFDAYLTWTNAKLTNSFKFNNTSQDDVYKSPETNIGFTFDTGIVWYPLPPYLALEVLGGYSIFSVDKADLKEGESELQSIPDIVDGGGFFAMAVMTVGIPFN